ncbi:MAG: hypothetical protein P1V97_32505 [Planctomycetota bacterium]|nr:hypothetical protein [Planctomycetota bacterium]
MSTHAVCKTHPDMPATLSCERCGNFVCEECPGFGELSGCASCIVEIYRDSQLFKRTARNASNNAAVTTFVVALILFFVFSFSKPNKPGVDWFVFSILLVLFLPLGWLCARGIIRNISVKLKLEDSKLLLPSDCKIACLLPPNLFLSVLMGLAWYILDSVFQIFAEPGAIGLLMFMYCAISLLLSGAMTVNKFESFQLRAGANTETTDAASK